MSRTFKFALPAMLFYLCLAMSSPAAAQGSNADRRPPAPARDESWNYQQQSGYEPNPQAIVQQKAMERSQQRSLRLASLSWYGMSNSRPTASSTPFMSMYSPAWQMPGGRPFAWNPGSPQLWNSYVR